MKKLFLLDVDGTILDGSRGMPDVSEKTKYAVKELAKENYVFISSGRCMGLLEEQIKQLGCNGYILCNGAYAQVEGKKIFSEYFNDEAVNTIIKVALENDGFYVLESLNRMFVNDLKAPNFIKFLKGWGKSIEGFEERENLGGKYHIAMLGFDSEENCLKSERLIGDVADMARHNGFKSYDVNIPGINKGVGTKKVIEYLGIEYEDTYCFGDGINDLEMLQAVGHPIIMANAAEDIKGYGFEETDDVLDDGIYNYLVSNMLIKPL